MAKLVALEATLDEHTAAVDVIEAALGKANEQNQGRLPTLTELSAMSAQLAQLNGTVERLQAVSIDAVQTAGLTSRKEEARALRKQLTRQATELIERIGVANERCMALQSSPASPPAAPARQQHHPGAALAPTTPPTSAAPQPQQPQETPAEKRQRLKDFIRQKRERAAQQAGARGKAEGGRGAGAAMGAGVGAVEVAVADETGNALEPAPFDSSGYAV
eukprot:g6144.t1